MNQTPEKVTQSPRIDLTKDPTIGWGVFLYDLIAVVFWTYTLTTLFAFDVVRYAFEKLLPAYVWLLDFKVIFFLGIIAFVAIFARRAKLVFWICYILLFPLVLLLWKIPKHVLKTGSLNIIFYFAFTVLSFFKNLRFNVVAGFVGTLSAAMALFSYNPSILNISSALLLGLLITTLAGRIISVFKPSDTFVVFRKITDAWQQSVVKKINEDKQIENLALISPETGNLTSMLSNVEQAMMSNRALLFSAKSLRDYQNSGISAVSGVFVTMFLVLITTVVFAIIYYAAYKIDPANFTYSGSPTGFAFFALSFKGMFFTGINEINPATAFTQAINMVQNFLSMFVGVIFVSIIFTSRNQALSYQIEQTIKKAEADGRAIEQAMLGRYQIGSLEELVLELRRLKSGGLVIIDFLTRRL